MTDLLRKITALLLSAVILITTTAPASAVENTVSPENLTESDYAETDDNTTNIIPSGDADADEPQPEGTDEPAETDESKDTDLLPQNIPSPKSADDGLSLASDLTSAADFWDFENPRTDESGIVNWDCVWFGNYWQSDTNGDGKADTNDDKQPIKWRILSINGDDAFLAADKELDTQAYKYNGIGGTSVRTDWNGCTVRNFLNRSEDGFAERAFTADELAGIITTTVSTPDNGRSGGAATTDKIYILSIPEAQNSDYGFGSNAARKCTMTDYAKTEYLKYYLSPGGNRTVNNYAWLRSPGSSTIATYENSIIDSSWGGINTVGMATAEFNYVRPVLHLDLSKHDIYSFAGTVSSNDQTESADDAAANRIKKINFDYRRDFYPGHADCQKQRESADSVKQMEIYWGFDCLKDSSEIPNTELAKLGAILSRDAYEKNENGEDDLSIMSDIYGQLGFDSEKTGWNNNYNQPILLNEKNITGAVQMSGQDVKLSPEAKEAIKNLVAHPLTYFGYKEATLDGEKRIYSLSRCAEQPQQLILLMT